VLLAPNPATKLEDHPLSAFDECLFNMFAVTLHIWRVRHATVSATCLFCWFINVALRPMTFTALKLQF